MTSQSRGDKLERDPPKGSVRDFKYPYKTLKDLKANSPSRKHGLTEEQEERWKRAAVDLIILVGLELHIDHVGTLTALEFLHRFYAEYSMVTNDRFLVSMACLYLAGKLADTPKSSRDIISASLVAISSSTAETKKILHDKEWMDAAKSQVFRAERALLYQLGFRFNETTAPQAMVLMLQESPLKEWKEETFANTVGTDAERFNQVCYHFTNNSAKVPLALQYSSEAIAAGCIWFTMQMMKLPTASLSKAYKGMHPWYMKYDLNASDLECISYQLTSSVVDDVNAAERLRNDAHAVLLHISVPRLESLSGTSNENSPGDGTTKKRKIDNRSSTDTTTTDNDNKNKNNDNAELKKKTAKDDEDYDTLFE